MFEKLEGYDSKCQLVIDVETIRNIIKDVQENLNSVEKENAELENRIRINTAKCVCLKGAMQMIDEIISVADVIKFDKEVKEVEEDKDLLEVKEEA